MRIIKSGHVYELKSRYPRPLPGSPEAPQRLTFVCTEEPDIHSGTTTQEVLRALIDRTRHCHNCLPHPNNERIVYHLRMALVLHEARALERQTEKGEIAPEYIETAVNGHFCLRSVQPPEKATTTMRPNEMGD